MLAILFVAITLAKLLNFRLFPTLWNLCCAWKEGEYICSAYRCPIAARLSIDANSHQG